MHVLLQPVLTMAGQRAPHETPKQVGALIMARSMCRPRPQLPVLARAAPHTAFCSLQLVFQQRGLVCQNLCLILANESQRGNR